MRHDLSDVFRVALAAAWAVSLLVCLPAGSTASGSPPSGAQERAPESQPQVSESTKTFPLTIQLTLKAKADLARADVKYVDIPSGKKVGLSYSGIRTPATIARLGTMGFRTSVMVSPSTSTEQLKELEDAGADLTLECGVCSEQGLTPQEAFDGATMRRLDVLGRCRSPVAVAGYDNMRSGFDGPTNRHWGTYLFAVHDSNYLACSSWAAGYKVLVGRNRTPEQVVRPYGSNASGGAPNTLVYFQTIDAILQGIVEMVAPGEVTSIGLREFKKEDMDKVEAILGKYGKDPRIWHTTPHEVSGYAYLKEKSSIQSARITGDAAGEITVAVERDIYLPFCAAPMTLQLPKDFPLASARLGATDCPVTRTEAGTYVDIPVRQALAEGCQMKLTTPPDLTIPESAPATLKIKNTSGKPMENATLRWQGNLGMEITGGTDKPFTLAPGAESEVAVTIRTTGGPRQGSKPKGTRFGLTPVSAFINCTVDGRERTFLTSWEILVAPRLRLEMDPRYVPMAKGDTFPFFVHIANGKVDKDRAWGRFSDAKLIDYRTGPCKGKLTLVLPEGMESDPPSATFDLPENGHATLRFTLKNNQWGDEKYVIVRPAVVLEGEKDPVELLWYGSAVLRDKANECVPLDDKGLLAYASWDNKSMMGFDKASGSTAAGGTADANGVKGWCAAWDSTKLTPSAVKNIDYRQGTVMFWTRRDAKVRNEMRVESDQATSWQRPPGFYSGFGEDIFCAGLERELTLRRLPKTRDHEGFFELVHVEMHVRGQTPRVHYAQIPYESDYDWHHIAIVWDRDARRLELYLDGKGVKAKTGTPKTGGGTADADDGPWLTRPFDNGREGELALIETHHGHWSGSARDELYIYNRPLSEEEIKANMNLAKPAK